MRKRRMQLSCTECRAKKLSCDRAWPCQRCFRAGRRDQCRYETSTGEPPIPCSASKDNNISEVSRLKEQVAVLKSLLTTTNQQNASESKKALDGPMAACMPTPAESLAIPSRRDSPIPVSSSSAPIHPQHRAPAVYHSRHSLFQEFAETPRLFSFVTEAAEEWLRPLGVSLKKEMPVAVKGSTTNEGRIPRLTDLMILLPGREETTTLISVYFDRFEHLHRIIHKPTFDEEYGGPESWPPQKSDQAVLLLSMLAIAVSAIDVSEGHVLLKRKFRTMILPWTSACDTWVRQESPKRRKLLHYQVMCLVYLARRLNVTRKKRNWNETGQMVQDAVIDGLAFESTGRDSAYIAEMKSRLWSTVRELDLQNVYESGLPSLLHCTKTSVTQIRNIDDASFRRETLAQDMPVAKPAIEFTNGSFQYHSAQSWQLRLDISRRLFSNVSQPLTYDEVLQYTHQVVQAIDAIPKWKLVPGDTESGKAVIVKAFLQFQLQECILAMHRPNLRRDSAKYGLSETICHQTAQDMMHLYLEVTNTGFQCAAQIRNDLMLASMTILRLSLLHDPSSANTIARNFKVNLELMQRCLPFMEIHYINCCPGEPWCFMTMYAMTALLKIHYGKETYESAKHTCAQRFLHLRSCYIKCISASPPQTNHSNSPPVDEENTNSTEAAKSLLQLFDSTLSNEQNMLVDFANFGADLDYDMDNFGLWDGTFDNLGWDESIPSNFETIS